MANFPNAPFSSLSNNDFFELFRHIRLDSDPVRGVSNSRAIFYDNAVAENLNSSVNELPYDFGGELTENMLCKYITVNQCKDIYESFSEDTFSLLHLNIRSLNKHFDELKLFLETDADQSFSVIGLSETWLNSNSESFFSIDGYKMFVNNRPDKSGGGVALYISHTFECIVHDDISRMDNIVESLFLEICIPGIRNIVVGIMYRPPNSNIKDFLTYLSDLVKSPVFKNKDCFFLGDFNIDLLKSGNNTVANEFLQIFLSSFLPLISKPRRVTDHSATLIDNLFCNTLPLTDSYMILLDMTDHYPIMTFFNLKTSVNNAKCFFHRLY